MGSFHDYVQAAGETPGQTSTSERPTRICTKCGMTSPPPSIGRAGCLVPLVISGVMLGLGVWLEISTLFWLSPAPLIICVRLLGDNAGTCPHCHCENCLVPIDSPTGKNILAQSGK